MKNPLTIVLGLKVRILHASQTWFKFSLFMGSYEKTVGKVVNLGGAR